MVGTTNKSMAAVSGARLHRKVRHPWLGGPCRLTIILGDGRLSHHEAKLEQFAVNARRTPKTGFNAHTPDQCPQICCDLRPASPRSAISSASNGEIRRDASAQGPQAE
jgi:hypothetical protein